MGELRRVDTGSGLYERLLHRLALALDEADTATRLRDEEPLELELKGLTPAEMELIRAYLDRDTRWLRGWHAAGCHAAVALLGRRDTVVCGLVRQPIDRLGAGNRPAAAGTAESRADAPEHNGGSGKHHRFRRCWVRAG